MDLSSAVWKLCDELHVVLQHIQPFTKLLRPVSQTVLHISLSLARASRSLGLMLHLRRFALMLSMKRFFGRPTECCPTVSSPYSNRRGSRLSGILITCPSHRSCLEEQVFSRSYSSFLKELSVWYFLPPSDAKDALQTADVKCLEGLDVSSIEGPRLRTVQHN